MSAASKWVWMPHAGHYICGNDCRFHLTTFVGKHIVSTVGEHLPDAPVREIFARSRGAEMIERGDARIAEYIKKVGYEKIGSDRLYETMVFVARAVEGNCCPWRMDNPTDLDFRGYNDAGAARLGHMELCLKWSRA